MAYNPQEMGVLFLLMVGSLLLVLIPSVLYVKYRVIPRQWVGLEARVNLFFGNFVEKLRDMAIEEDEGGGGATPSGGLAAIGGFDINKIMQTVQTVGKIMEALKGMGIMGSGGLNLGGGGSGGGKIGR